MYMLLVNYLAQNHDLSVYCPLSNYVFQREYLLTHTHNHYCGMYEDKSFWIKTMRKINSEIMFLMLQFYALLKISENLMFPGSIETEHWKISELIKGYYLKECLKTYI